MVRVVGIDPSLTSTGLAFIKDGEVRALGNIKSRPAGNDLAKVRDRLYDIANDVYDWTVDLHPDLVVIENPSYASKYGSPHERAGLWWLIAGPLSCHYPVARVSPQGRAKYGTGAGNSAKAVVFASVKEHYQDLTTERIKNDDIGDAVLLAAMGARHLGQPVERHELSDGSLAALTGVLWPAT